MLGHPDHQPLPPNLDTHYAWLRTRLSVENTLMAWIRTTTTLIGFGFTIYQFFDKFLVNSDAPNARPEAPRNMGLGLIAVGVLALAFAIWRFAVLTRYLEEIEFGAGGIGDGLPGVKRLPGRNTPYVVSILLLAIGLFAFVSILFWG